MSGVRPDGRGTFFCFAKRKYPKKRRPSAPALRATFAPDNRIGRPGSRKPGRTSPIRLPSTQRARRGWKAHHRLQRVVASVTVMSITYLLTLDFMSSRAHDRSHFYKYASLDTALRIISTKSFRWSSPLKFNDPFDHQTGFVLNYVPDELANHLTAAIERIVFSEEDPKIDPRSLFSAATLKLREMRHKLPRAKVLESIHETSIECAQRQQNIIQQLNDETQKHLCHSRVFCVSELLDNVVMWSHYADDHRGVAFKLKCIDEIDNTLLAARKVNYQNEFLPFPAAEIYVKHLTGECCFDWADLMWEMAYIKHQDWAYEREWRVHDLLPENSPELN